MITSTHNPKIQLARAVMGRSSDRRKEKAFAAEGVRLVEEAVQAGWPFRFVLFTGDLSERGKAIIAQLQSQKVACEEVSPGVLNSVSETQNSQGLLAVLEQATLPVPDKLTFALVLDSVRDPGNLGTLLRTAAAAGVEVVFLPPETADAFAPKVLRAGMGAHFHMPVQSLTWEEIKSHLSGLDVYLAEMEATLSCWEADFRSPLALVIGGEAEGATQAARELAHQAVAIPMPGKAESLNAAMAGTILLFEVVRQRGIGR